MVDSRATFEPVRFSLPGLELREHASPAPAAEPVIRTEKLTIRYGDFAAVRDASLDIPPHQVTAIIGPSGCGKSTLLRAMNRMNDFIPKTTVEGVLSYRGQNVYGPDCDPVELRRRIGMVFQKPNPFPKSIFDNVAWGAKINGFKGSKGDLSDLVERALRQAALWDEVKDKLDASGLSLSGGQQQRLCIARALAIEPEVILMDEPCSALDPIATARIEELIDELRSNFCIIIVTHSMQQAARVSQRTAFFHLGILVEEGETQTIFTNPSDERTRDYITGRFG